MIAGGSVQTIVSSYGSGSSLDTGNLGFPGVTIPSSGGLGLRCMLTGSDTRMPSCWVLRNGNVYSTNTSGTVTRIALPEPIVGLFTASANAPGAISDIMSVGASGAVYNLGSPSVVAYTLPIKAEFCGFIVESVSNLNTYGAFYISGEGKAYRYALTRTWVNGSLQTVATWNQVALSQVKPGTPNTPLPFDNLSVLYSGVVP